MYNSTFLILSWFLCQTFGGVFKFDCCLWAKRTIAKMCEQFNILDFILIFVPNSWGSYRVRLLFLGPEGGGDCTNSKMSVHFNIFDSILIFCQKFGGVFKLDCCLWALREGGHNFQNVCTIQHFWLRILFYRILALYSHVCMYVCMSVSKRDISFPSDSKLTQPLPR